MSDYHSSQISDLQSSIDYLRRERDIYRQLAVDLYNYFVDGSGSSRAVSRYIQIIERGDLSESN